jgi:hypothetical protein
VATSVAVGDPLVLKEKTPDGTLVDRVMYPGLAAPSKSLGAKVCWAIWDPNVTDPVVLTVQFPAVGPLTGHDTVVLTVTDFTRQPCRPARAGNASRAARNITRFFISITLLSEISPKLHPIEQEYPKPGNYGFFLDLI